MLKRIKKKLKQWGAQKTLELMAQAIRQKKYAPKALMIRRRAREPGDCRPGEPETPITYILELRQSGEGPNPQQYGEFTWNPDTAIEEVADFGSPENIPSTPITATGVREQVVEGVVEEVHQIIESEGQRIGEASLQEGRVTIQSQDSPPEEPGSSRGR